MTVALFAVTTILSAALLFVVQPMMARMLLPMMGGTPATWTTSLLFFQVVLLAGYAYAHFTTARLGVRAQKLTHVVVLLAATMAPIGVAQSAVPPSQGAITWILTTLTLSVGLPFFALSATAPLLQRWMVLGTGRDPYFLYAASNLGSFAGLLAYPLLIEPTSTLAAQRQQWSGAFLALSALIGCCAAVTKAAPLVERPVPPVTTSGAPVGVRDRLTWLALSGVASSLLLGVTAHVSTDVAAVPLLWVIPLALYLLSFMLAFSASRQLTGPWLSRLARPAIAGALATAVAAGVSWPVGLAVHFCGFFVVALACHVELADRRPAPRFLTEYFLWVAAGGAVGGAFNAVAAPVVFNAVLEYPIALVIAALLLPLPNWRSERLAPTIAVVGLPLIVFGVLAASWLLGVVSGVDPGAMIVAYWLGTGGVLSFSNSRSGFALALAVAAVANSWYPQGTSRHLVFAERSFFGVHRVDTDSPGTFHRLIHGTTVHGWQALPLRGCDPTGYYVPDGPIGQVMLSRPNGAERVAVIGLGAGGLACYALEGSHWRFYEIDPAVERIARNPSLFSFLANSRAHTSVTLGDGRLGLSTAPPGSFDVLIADAFSSDAVPVHLLTEEFVRLAVDRLRPGGVAAFHISNRYLDLGPTLAATASAAGFVILEQSYSATEPPALSSQWAVIARTSADFGALAVDRRWHVPRPASQGWSDDFSNILDVLR